MSDVPGRDVWSDLVGGLLDARTDPATARFDADLAAAVADGSVTQAAAHRLRFWQRASVRALTDHARTVLPVALGAVAAAREDAERYADQAAAALDAAELKPEPEPEPVDEAVEPAPAEAPGEIILPDPPRRASTSWPTRPTTLEERRPRVLVAGLTTVTASPAPTD
jgi:hypothetical protein